MNKKIAAIALAGLTALTSASMLSACGTKEGITIYIYGQSHERAIYQKIIDKFTEETGIAVTPNLVNEDGYDQTLTASLNTKNCPDVFYVDPAAVASYANNGVIIPLDDLLVEEKNSGGFDYTDYVDGVLDYYMYDTATKTRFEGKTYAVPKDISAYPLSYNKVIIDKAVANGRWAQYCGDLLKPWETDPATGEQVVYTWEEFSNACLACSFTEGSNKYFGTALIDTYAMHSWIWTAGADWLSEDGTTVTVNTPEFIEGMNEFIDLMDNRGVSQSRAEMNASTHYERWMQGQVAFFNVGVWDIAAFETVSKSILDYDLMPTPKKDKDSEWYTYIGTLGYAVSSRCSAPQDALKLAMYMGLSEESYNRMSKYQVIQLPNSKSKLAEYFSDPDVKAPANRALYYEVITGGHGKLYPTALTYDSLWYDEFIDGLSDCWKADDDPTTKPKKTVQEFCAYIQSYMQEELDTALANEAEGL